jgi:hypothetical protein
MTCKYYLDRVIPADLPIPAGQSLCMNSPYGDIEILHESCGKDCPNYEETEC